MTYILEADNLVVGYSEVPILRGVSLTVEPGEVVAIIGPNGAGKSTLIKALFGVLKPLMGRIVFDGRDITGWTPEAIVPLGMSYVPQVNNVFRTLSVRENLQMGSYILNYGPSGLVGSLLSRLLTKSASPRYYSSKWQPGTALETRLDQVLQLFPDLKDRLRDRTGNLSGGQQQMVALARALMLNPKVLLIDEPSAGLAPKLVDSVFRRIEAVNQAGTTIVLVEQNARKALELADRGYVLEAGQRRLVDQADRILANPDIGRMFLGESSAGALGGPRPDD
jgi:neutral amino acid transport system ATP-binding protein